MNKENTDVIKAHYNAAPQMEWDRTDERRVEYIITTKVISRYIKKGDKVLDIGGGPGRYSTWLAACGCDVTLFDLSEGNVCFAENKAKELGIELKTICGNALDKAMYPDEYFDHILVMGPMYHIYNEADRRTVIDNALLHLKPNGKIYIAFINLFAGAMYYLEEFLPGFKNEIDSGNGYGECITGNKSWQGMAFTEARFEALPDIKRFCNSFGLKQLTLFGQEGFLGSHLTAIEALEEPHRSLWIDYAYRMCEMEDYLNMSAHIMYVGEKINE
jgi:SAM-dependent methyltransferase